MDRRGHDLMLLLDREKGNPDLASEMVDDGLPAQQLRSDAALVIEWFRLCLRHRVAWVGAPK